MRNRLIALSILLAGSVLLNIILLRRPENPEIPQTPPVKEAAAAQELRDRLERAKAELLTMKAELANMADKPKAAASTPAEAEDRVSLFRRRLQKLNPVRKQRHSHDPVERARESELTAEFHRLELDRQQDPATYGKCMTACLEQMVQELEPPLDQDQ